MLSGVSKLCVDVMFCYNGNEVDAVVTMLVKI